MPDHIADLTYCGPPPLPETLWGRWNADPVLLTVLALAIGLFFSLRREAAPRERWSFCAGVAGLAIAFVSPLCALTVALFSARVVHHVLLVAVAAPLLALALPFARVRLSALLTPLLLLHTAVFWLWHAPDAYALALSDTAVYWLMQASLLGTALLFWRAAFDAAAGRAITALVFATIQMGLLGALLVFAARPLYAPHFSTTAPFGLDALADQQLAGLIMWVPAALPYLAVALVRLLLWLNPPEARRA